MRKQIEMRLIFSPEKISRRVSNLAKRISTDYQSCDLVLTGVLKAAFIFLADLARQTTTPVEKDFVCLANYGASTSSSGQVQIISDVKLGQRDRDLLVIENIVDSGLTLNFVRNHLLTHKPRSSKICALLGKVECHAIPVKLDYVVLEVQGGFPVRYGLDCDGSY